MEGLLHRLAFSRQMALILDFLNYGVPNCCIVLRHTVKVYSGILLKDLGPEGQDLKLSLLWMETQCPPLCLWSQV